MKIAYLIEDFSMKGGAERIIAQKADLLAEYYGHDVAIISVFHDDRPPAYPLHGVKFESLDVPFAMKKGGIMRKTLSRTRVLMQTAMRFNKAMAAFQPDIIFFTLGLGALLLPLYRGKARRIYESHSARRFTPYHSFFIPMELKADAIVCLTDGDAKEYKHAKRVEIIPNFVEPFEKHTINYAVRRAIAVGRLEHVKGFDRLIRCWNRAAKSFPGWRLDIYGEGSQREVLQRQIDDAGTNDTVRLCGRTENIMQTYPEYSLNLVSSRYEGFSMTLLEAQAAGLPAVTFDFKYGARSIVKDGVTGIIVPQDDEEAFTKALERMLSDEGLRRKYGTEAAKASDRFACKEVMGKWNSLINSFQR